MMNPRLSLTLPPPTRFQASYKLKTCEYVSLCLRLTVYVYACRLKRFYVALLVFVASFLFIIIWPAAGGEAVSD